MMNRSLTLQPTNNGWLIIFDLSKKIEYTPVSSVLDLVVSITRSEAAHLYWIDPAAYELRLVSASSTLEDSRIARVSLEFPVATRRWLESLEPAGMLSAADPHYVCFPETKDTDVSHLLVLPLRSEGKVAGILTMCRKEAGAYGTAEIDPAAKLAAALVAAMKELDRQREIDFLRDRLRSARQENNLLERRLAERKLVERAKGLLQIHNGWSEEDAYYHIRRSSRQQRTPMGVIAQRIIDVHAAKEVERERLTA